MTSDSLASIRGRIGAYSLHSQYDGREITQAARGRFLQRFEDEVDAERQLPPQERQRRAQMARRAYFLKLALASAKARRRRKGTTA